MHNINVIIIQGIKINKYASKMRHIYFLFDFNEIADFLFIVLKEQGYAFDSFIEIKQSIMLVWRMDCITI